VEISLDPFLMVVATMAIPSFLVMALFIPGEIKQRRDARRERKEHDALTQRRLGRG